MPRIARSARPTLGAEPARARGVTFGVSGVEVDRDVGLAEDQLLHGVEASLVEGEVEVCGLELAGQLVDGLPHDQ